MNKIDSARKIIGIRSLKLFFAVACLSSFILGAFLFHLYSASPELSSIHPLRLGKKGLINPLLEYVSPGTQDKSNFPELIPITNKLGNIIEEAKNDNSAKEVGIYFRDLQTGHWTGIQENKKFSPASLLKVPLMIAYLKLAQANQDMLSKTIFYDGSFDDNVKEDIKPVKSITPEKSYTVDELIRYMIAYSDNNAAALLYANIDKNFANKIYGDIGNSPPISTDDFMSPKAYSLFFRVLYNSTYLNADLSEKALTLLSYNDFPPGIQGGLPENVIAAEKFGEHQFSDGTKELHDCGIVYHPTTSYVLCIMTKGDNFIKLGNIIRNVSAAVYKEVDSNYKN